MDSVATAADDRLGDGRLFIIAPQSVPASRATALTSISVLLLLLLAVDELVDRRPYPLVILEIELSQEIHQYL